MVEGAGTVFSGEMQSGNPQVRGRYVSPRLQQHPHHFSVPCGIFEFTFGCVPFLNPSRPGGYVEPTAPDIRGNVTISWTHRSKRSNAGSIVFPVVFRVVTLARGWQKHCGSSPYSGLQRDFVSHP